MPTTIQCDSACEVTLVISTPWQSLTAADGLQIVSAILLVWVVGWGFRTLIRFLKESDETSKGDES